MTVEISLCDRLPPREDLDPVLGEYYFSPIPSFQPPAHHQQIQHN